MKKVIALIMILSVIAISAINKISYTYTFTGQTSPKVTWLDADFLTAKNAINKSIDTINRLRDTTFKYLYGRSYTGSGAVVNASSPTIINPVLTSPTIGLINGLNDTVSIADGDTLQGQFSNIGFQKTDTLYFYKYIKSNDGAGTIGGVEIDAVNKGIAATLFNSKTNGGYTFDFSGSFLYGLYKDVNGVRLIANDIKSEDSLYTISFKATGRATATDFEASDSIKSVTGEYSGRVKATDFEASDSIIGKRAILETNSYPVIKATITSSTTNTINTPIALKHKTSSSMIDGFGTSLNFVIEDNNSIENIISYIAGIRNGADNSGKMVFGVVDGGFAKGNLIYTKDDLSMTGKMSADSSRVKAQYRPIRTISSGTFTALTKEYSFVFVTNGGTVYLPDANGSGFVIDVCTDGDQLSVLPNPANAGDIELPNLCPPGSGVILSAECTPNNYYHGFCANFVDCASNTWCTFSSSR